MKHIFLVVFFGVALYSSIIKTPILSIDEKNKVASIEVANLEVGMSGYISHKLGDGSSIILNTTRIKEYDTATKIAKVTIEEFDLFHSNSLPSANWKAEVGDSVILAFGYDRALLIAPTEEVYDKVSAASQVTWVHPDIFATTLSKNGHPTPLKEDFKEFSIDNSVGIVFIFLDGRVFTLDANSFKILAISEAQITHNEPILPFYSRVEEIEAAWWGEGSSRLSKYDPYYYELIIKANRSDKALYDIVSSSHKRSVKSLVSEFDFKGNSDDKKRFFGLF